MTHSGDAAEQVVRLSLDGVEYVVKIAGAGAKNLASLLLAALRTKKAQPTTLKVSGQERLRRMLKSGRPLDVFSVREKDIKTFTQEAKKYGIVYCAIRDKEPKADGVVDVLVRTEDAPKINRIMERLEYSAVDTATIKSEIAKTKAEQGAEPSTPDKSDNLDVDSFLDDIMPDEGKSKEGPPAAQKDVPERTPEPFFSMARTKQNPSEHGLDTSSKPERKTTEPPSVKEELRQIRSALKKEAESRKEQQLQQTGKAQKTTQHRQPQNTRKPKSKNTKER